MSDIISKEHFGDTHVRRISSVCDLCVEYEDTGSACPSCIPDGYVQCCRPIGHDGPHAACGIQHTHHPLFVWAEVADG